MARCHLCRRPVHEVWASATDIEYETTDERFRYHRCRDCDALSIDPLPEDRLEQIYPPAYYSFASGDAVLDADRNAVTRFKSRLDRRAFLRALTLAGRPASPRVLDVGGGTGEIAARFVAGKPAAQATVVDLDARSVDVARSRGLGGFVGRIEDFETDERFHLILMLNLIEHVADPRAVLTRARELLAPGGVVWVQTPNFHSLDATVFRNLNWTGLHCPRHWVVMGEAGLRKALAHSGLTPARLERAQGGSFWATSILGLGRSRRGPKPEMRAARPLVALPAFMPLAALGAGFDLVTRRWRETSQLVAYARRSAA